jgi:hypothetical protein
LDEDGRFVWYGFAYDSDLTDLANTTCTSATNCSPFQAGLLTEWLKVFRKGNKNADLTTLSLEEYSRLFRLSINKYASVIGTGDPDLTSFKAGGKMITWHGIADQRIPYKNIADYYDQVTALDPNTPDYYRFFMAPSIDHCGYGQGWYLGGIFDDAVEWVENGKAPDTLYAEAVWAERPGNVTRAVELCAYPKVLTYVGGKGNQPSSFTCV